MLASAICRQPHVARYYSQSLCVGRRSSLSCDGLRRIASGGIRSDYSRAVFLPPYPTFTTTTTRFLRYKGYSNNRPMNSFGVKEPQPNQTIENQTITQRLRIVFRDYGTTGFVFHTIISLISLGCWYSVVNSGIDVKHWLKKIGFGEETLQSVFATGGGTFIIAYALHKATVLPRAMLTITTTPIIVRHLRRIGIIRKPPVRPPITSSPKS